MKGLFQCPPRATPWVRPSKQQSRPERAKASDVNAFALSGRLSIYTLYPGRCPGLGASALSGRAGIELLLGSEIEEEHSEQDEEEIHELRLEILLVEDGCTEEEADDD